MTENCFRKTLSLLSSSGISITGVADGQMSFCRIMHSTIEGRESGRGSLSARISDGDAPSYGAQWLGWGLLPPSCRMFLNQTTIGALVLASNGVLSN